MSKRESLLYLQDILDSISKIFAYTNSRSYEKLVNDEMALDAIVRNLEIIGEAAKNVPSEVKEKYPNVPWREIGGTRNKILHEYFGINLEIIWKTIQEDLPILEREIKTIVGGLK